MSLQTKKKRVLVAMSGGVDSSVAAALLVDQGYEVIGATMQVWDYSECDLEEGNGTCCSSLDVDDARSVADRLGIAFYVLNCEAKFKTNVIDPFLKAYLQGQTPLPCVNCNTFLKFDHLIQKMRELECDYLATGHYAQILPGENGEPAIHTSTDDWKDQTYFLFTIQKELLSKILFPVGHLNKSEVRKIAEEKQLVVAKKKDSTGICFVGDKGYAKFIEENVPASVLKTKSGVIKRYPSGEVMGDHLGIHHFTYGQSKGLGLTFHEKLFVLKIDSETNTVWVGDEQYLFKNEVNVIEPYFLHPLHDGEKLSVKIRYTQKGSLAKVFQDGGKLKVVFEEPQRAVTPGQAAVFYRGRQLLGGGWITL
jgi:tRNA-specific 2-thiouridylase